MDNFKLFKLLLQRVHIFSAVLRSVFIRNAKYHSPKPLRKYQVTMLKQVKHERAFATPTKRKENTIYNIT